MVRPVLYNHFLWAGLKSLKAICAPLVRVCYERLRYLSGYSKPAMLGLLITGFLLGVPASAQLHQPFRNQAYQSLPDSSRPSFQRLPGSSKHYFEPFQGRYQKNSLIRQRPNRVTPVSNYEPETQFVPSGQLPPAPAELYAPNSTLKQPTGNTVPPLPPTLPNPGGHTFEPGRNLAPLAPAQSGSLYHSPYDNAGGNTFQVPDQSLPYSTQPQDCLDCLDGFYGYGSAWGWTVMPKDILYQSYLGGPREPRFGQAFLYRKGSGTIWSLEAGGRAGILRYGSGPGEPLEGWQLDLWGAAFPRLNMNENSELDAVDFKVGVPLTWRKGPVQLKFEWSHISSHAGDEFMIRNPTFVRIDYLRDSFLLGGGYFVNPDLRLYADAEFAYNTNGGSEPWHFQFGFDYSPVCTSDYQSIRHPQPFLASSANLRQEVNFSGGINVVAGLQWRSDESTSLFRIGLQYYQGQSLQYEFLGVYEELIGLGMWYDF